MSKQSPTALPRRSNFVWIVALGAMAWVTFDRIATRRAGEATEIALPQHGYLGAAKPAEVESGVDGPPGKFKLPPIAATAVVLVSIGLIVGAIYATVRTAGQEPLGIASLTTVVGTATLLGLMCQGLADVFKGRLQDGLRLVGHGLVIMGAAFLAASLWVGLPTSS